MEGKLDKKTKSVIEEEIIKFVVDKTIYIVTTQKVNTHDFQY